MARPVPKSVRKPPAFRKPPASRKAPASRPVSASKAPAKGSRKTTTPTRRTPWLLLAVDFSPASRFALEAARSLAADLGAGIVLLHASPTSPPPVPFTTPKGRARDVEAAGRAAAADAARLSAEWAESLRADGLRVETTNPVGPPVKEILDEARRRSCTAIVLGTTGPTGVKGWLLGSTAREVLRRSQVPVLVAPARMRKAKPGGRQAAARTLLVAVDFSDESEAAYEAGLRLAKDLKAQVRLLHVVNLPLPSIPFPYSGAEFTLELLDQDEALAAGELAELASRAGAQGIHVTPSLGLGHPASVILSEARQSGASLIVVGTHGKSASRRFFLGSVAESVVQLADRPVLVVPDPEATAAGAWVRSA